MIQKTLKYRLIFNILDEIRDPEKKEKAMALYEAVLEYLREGMTTPQFVKKVYRTVSNPSAASRIVDLFCEPAYT